MKQRDERNKLCLLIWRTMSGMYVTFWVLFLKKKKRETSRKFSQDRRVPKSFDLKMILQS